LFSLVYEIAFTWVGNHLSTSIKGQALFVNNYEQESLPSEEVMGDSRETGEDDGITG
jgi:hypothetical protein